MYRVDGRDIAGYTGRQLTAYRREDIGFVFQFYNLVPNLTALENVELALQICKEPLDARTVLQEVGLKDRLGQFPGTAFRWRTAESFHSQSTGKESKTSYSVMSQQVHWIIRQVRQF